MTSQTKRENLITEIKKIRKDIKSKHKALTGHAIIEQRELEKKFKPITQPLNKLMNLHDFVGDKVVKMGDKETKVKRRQSDEEIKQIKRSRTRQPTVDYETEIFESSPTLQEVLSSPEGRNSANVFINEMITGKLANEYMHKFINDNDEEIDHIYGPNFNNETLTLGNLPIQFENDDIILNDETYTGTRGLYELIFMKDPDSSIYAKEDLDTYGLILKSTNAHKQGNRIKDKNAHKYKNIIKTLVSRKGAGLMTLSNNKTDYVYWDDPNELCDRLRLLISSRNIGHTGHNNEIISIINELRQSEIIK